MGALGRKGMRDAQLAIRAVHSQVGGRFSREATRNARQNVPSIASVK